METLKLRTDKENRFGRTILIAGHNIAFNSEGVCQVEDSKLAKTLIDDYGLYQGEKRIKEEKVNEESKPKQEDLKNDQKDMIPVSALKELQAKCQKLEKDKEAAEKEVVELKKELKKFEEGGVPDEAGEVDSNPPKGDGSPKEDEDEDIIKAIQLKTRKELLELCEEMEFPKEEYKSLTAANLKKYMVGKLEEK